MSWTSCWWMSWWRRWMNRRRSRTHSKEEWEVSVSELWFLAWLRTNHFKRNVCSTSQRKSINQATKFKTKTQDNKIPFKTEGRDSRASVSDLVAILFQSFSSSFRLSSLLDSHLPCELEISDTNSNVVVKSFVAISQLWDLLLQRESNPKPSICSISTRRHPTSSRRDLIR